MFTGSSHIDAVKIYPLVRNKINICKPHPYIAIPTTDPNINHEQYRAASPWRLKDGAHHQNSVQPIIKLPRIIKKATISIFSAFSLDLVI